jgi:pyruvate/2-oxoglutarate dehydrogenase complex dihydrolipoamide dehydrogenase (E3) component
MTARQFDLVIVGAGQAGVPLSRAAAETGLTVALVEREHVAGTCINEGCTPTKTMAASARVAYLARRAVDFGVSTGTVAVDMVRVRRRKREIVESWRAGSEQRLRSTPNLELMMGQARFTGVKTLEVALNDGGTASLKADRVVINSGARPAVPDIPGLAEVPFLDSTSVMELGAVPEHLLILGGGYVALEFGQMFRRFGSAVTIVQRSPHLLSREDDDVADAVTHVLREDGVEVLLDTRVQRADRAAKGGRLTVTTLAGERVLTGSHLLVATGRVPNTEQLRADLAGVSIDPRGFIVVDERLETTASGVFAAGDVKGGPAFTHISYDDFRILRTNLLQGGAATITDRQVPYTVFIDPQLGRIGLTEKEARARGLRIKVASMPMSWVARALEMDEPRGVMKAVVDAETDRILGAAILGVDGGELMAVIQTAMLGGVTAATLRETTFAHPTLAESLNNLFAGLT